jgi:hypothetical protein
MNLRSLFFKNPADVAAPRLATGTITSSGNIDEQGPGGIPTESNIVTFPLTPGYYEAGANSAQPPFNRPLTPSQARHNSLIDTPELSAYFRVRYFDYGYHTGVRFRSSEALELGRQEHIAVFQNIITQLVQRKKTKIVRLQHELLGIEAISAVMSAQLKLAWAHLDQEIAALTEQHDLSSHGKGWVRQALAPFEVGFAKGMRTAIEFDVLAG